MQKHQIARTDLHVTRLCVGCMNFGDTTNKKEARRIIDRTLDLGGNFLDTANVYNERKGEEILGEALIGRRGDAVVATKVQAPMFESKAVNHRAFIVEQCHASLKRLRTDYIDLYQLNWPQDDTPIDEVMTALDELIREGKVREIGWSTIAPWQAVEFNFHAREKGYPEFVSVQFPYHPLDRRGERELIPMGKKHMGALMAWGPLAGGFLAGKYEKSDATNKARELRWGITRDHFRDESFAVLDALREIARALDCSPARVATAWCAGSPGITNVIAGPRTVEHLDEYVHGMELELSPEERRRIDQVAPPGSFIVPYLIADLGPGKFFW